jgi:RHS repeat-associated protein
MQILGYTGARVDAATGTYPLGNGYRSYVPGLMRFGAPDDLSPFGAGGINPYVYCDADPINLSDPSGHWSLGALSSLASRAYRYVAGFFDVHAGGAKIGAAMHDIGRIVVDEDSRFANAAMRKSRIVSDMRKLRPDRDVYAFESPMEKDGKALTVLAHGTRLKSTGEMRLVANEDTLLTGEEFAQELRQVYGEDIAKKFSSLNLIVCLSAPAFGKEVGRALKMPAVAYEGLAWAWESDFQIENMTSHYGRLLDSAKVQGETDPSATADAQFRGYFQGRKYYLNEPDYLPQFKASSKPRFFPYVG